MMVPGCFGEEATKRTGFQSHSRVGNEPWKAQGATEVLQRCCRGPSLSFLPLRGNYHIVLSLPVIL